MPTVGEYFDGFVQDCSISSANALDVLQSYTDPWICVLQDSSDVAWMGWDGANLTWGLSNIYDR